MKTFLLADTCSERRGRRDGQSYCLSSLGCQRAFSNAGSLSASILSSTPPMGGRPPLETRRFPALPLSPRILSGRFRIASASALFLKISSSSSDPSSMPSQSPNDDSSEALLAFSARRRCRRPPDDDSDADESGVRRPPCLASQPGTHNPWPGHNKGDMAGLAPEYKLPEGAANPGEWEVSMGADASNACTCAGALVEF